jgi:hypothetical protein
MERQQLFLSLRRTTKSRPDVRNREQRLGNSPGLRPGGRIIDERNFLFMLKKNKGIQSVFFSCVNLPIEKTCKKDHSHNTFVPHGREVKAHGGLFIVHWQKAIRYRRMRLTL